MKKITEVELIKKSVERKGRGKCQASGLRVKEGDKWDGKLADPFLDLAPAIMGRRAPKGVYNFSSFEYFHLLISDNLKIFPN